MKIFTIAGARPNFIKIDRNLPDQTIVHTGQHYDYKMSKIFFKGLDLAEPAYNLNCTDVGKMIDKLCSLLKREKPNLVIVIGDTNSALAGALAASMENIKIAHVEAGMRSGDKIPEEKNRIVIDKLSQILFCPNQQAQLNLAHEGIKQNVFVVGDPLFDAMGRFMPIKKNKKYQQYDLLTTHRNINVDDKESLQRILNAIGVSGFPTVFPVHPRTRKNLKGMKIPENIKLKMPQGYKEMLHLISNARKVITDSGGVQREAAWMNVPVIILRDVTEWHDLVNKGCAILVGTNEEAIIHAIQNFKGKLISPPQPNVNERIRNIIYKHI